MVSIINVIIVVNQVSVIIKILTDVVDVIFFIITTIIIAIKTVRFTSSSSSSLAYDHILAYLLKTSLHHYFLTKSRLRPKARGQKRATKSRDEHRTTMNRKQASRKSIIVYHYINI